MYTCTNIDISNKYIYIYKYEYVYIYIYICKHEQQRQNVWRMICTQRCMHKKRERERSIDTDGCSNDKRKRESGTNGQRSLFSHILYSL